MKTGEGIHAVKLLRGSLFLYKIFLVIVFAFAPGAAQHSTTKFERDAKTGDQIPIGFTPRDILADTLYSYHRWFNRNYSGYSIDTALTTQLKGALTDDIELLVFYGTWCSDTRRELPRLMKILDAVGFAQDRVKMCAVDRAKLSGDDVATRHKVKRVATIIVYRSGKELGRIIEKPKLGLESDMLQILRGEPAKAE